MIDRLRQDIRATDGTAGTSRQLEHLQVLERRAATQLEKLSSHLAAIYGAQRAPEALESLLDLFITRGLERPDDLRQLDAAREHDPNWFCSNKAIGANMYVDRHCGTLSKLAQEIGYLQLMNVSMLHLLPTIYKTPPTDNDGGYAISDFRCVNPAIGTMDELRDLFRKLRKAGISPIMDVTINHVAHDHAWAEAAKSGDPEKLAYFFAKDGAEKDEYEKHLEQMFPDIRAGNFTWNEEIGKFIWTSFMSSQWDLDYANPQVLRAMSDEMLFLLNQGAQVLRLDAVPMIWKELGTACNNLPQVQSVLGVFNAMTRIAAPGSVLISEAIDKPAEIKRNLGPDKCQLAYNTIALTNFWDALAHADASLMATTLKAHADIPQGSALLNMIRTHDDLPFHFDPGAAEALGIDLGQRHKSLGEFYLGGTSHAKAVEFCGSRDPAMVFLAGTTGSLAGMEKAIEDGDVKQAEAAIRRIRLLNGLLLSLPGVPMLNLTGGDDRGQTNDYSCMQDESLGKDTRWVHRVRRDLDFRSMSPLQMDAMNRVFNDTVELNRARTEMPAFGAGPIQVIDTGKAPVLAFSRQNEEQKVVVVLANFSQSPQLVEPEHLRAHGMTHAVIDRIGPDNDQARPVGAGIELAPYQCMWLVPANRDLPQTRYAEAATP